VPFAKKIDSTALRCVCRERCCAPCYGTASDTFYWVQEKSSSSPPRLPFALLFVRALNVKRSIMAVTAPLCWHTTVLLYG
jgi:hypothetical protein